MSDTPVAPAAVIGSIEVARRDMYRLQILSAAEIEFGRSGFANTKLSAIARTSDLSLLTVYKHFDGKAQIWDELQATRMAQLLLRVEQESVPGGTSLERILVGVRSVASYLIERPAYLDMNLWAGTGWASGKRGAHGVQETVWNAGLDAMVAGVERAVADREIPAIDARVAAGLIVSSLQVWLAAWVERGRIDDSSALLDTMIVRLRWTPRGNVRLVNGACTGTCGGRHVEVAAAPDPRGTRCAETCVAP